MSRSGYTDGLDQQDLAMYRGRVASAMRGNRGQAFLRELAETMDAMPEKVLIAGKLIDDAGCCCAIGAVCKARGVDVSKVDYEEPESVGDAVNIAGVMAAEIEYVNDDDFSCQPETPEQRWLRVRQWVEGSIRDKPHPAAKKPSKAR